MLVILPSMFCGIHCLDGGATKHVQCRTNVFLLFSLTTFVMVSPVFNSCGCHVCVSIIRTRATRDRLTTDLLHDCGKKINLDL